MIPLQTRLRYTTMIVLPDGEEILDVICGDRDFWVISAAQNVAHVKPAKAGAETNLNLVTARGTIYSFLLTEKSGTSAAGPQGLRQRRRTRRRRAAEVLQRRRGRAPPGRTAEAHEGSGRALNSGRAETVALERQQYPDPTAVRLRHAEVREAVPRARDLARRAVHLPEVRRHRAAGALRAEGRQARRRELPGAGHGTYVVPKVLERGYLALGNARFAFEQRER